MLNPGYSKASAQYRALALSAQTENADPHRLVVMLYDELLLCLDVLVRRAERHASLIGDAQAHRARGIILALRAGLDFENGGALAFTLDSLYDGLSGELEQKLSAPDPLRLAELRAGVESLAAAWRAIAED